MNLDLSSMLQLADQRLHLIAPQVRKDLLKLSQRCTMGSRILNVLHQQSLVRVSIKPTLPRVHAGFAKESIESL